MVEAHLDAGAAASVAAIRQPIKMADQFGVIDVDPAQPNRIRAFLEKPTAPEGLPDSPEEILASMGNYVFDAEALVEAVTRDAEVEDSRHDMGGDIIPYFVSRGEAFVYDFRDNEVPGSLPRDRDYWRDVGTLESYYDAHTDLISVLPAFNLYNYDWPIYTSYGLSWCGDQWRTREGVGAVARRLRGRERASQLLGAAGRCSGRRRRTGQRGDSR
jgi:glucose-1-phosphate adenylyltransferase